MWDSHDVAGACRGDVHPHMESTHCHDRFDRLWTADVNRAKQTGRRPGLFKVLFQSVGIWTILLASLLAATQVGIRMVVPRIFRTLIDSLVHPNPNVTLQWIYAASFLVLPVVGSYVNNAHDVTMARAGITMGTSLNQAIFRKSLKVCRCAATNCLRASPG